MKLKQVAGIVFISAATTLGSLWGYNHFNQSREPISTHRIPPRFRPTTPNFLTMKNLPVRRTS